MLPSEKWSVYLRRNMEDVIMRASVIIDKISDQ